MRAPVAATGAGDPGDPLVEPVDEQVGRLPWGRAVRVRVHGDAREPDRGARGDRPFAGRIPMPNHPHVGVHGSSSGVGEDDSDLLLEVFDEIGRDAPAELDDGGEIRERD